MEISIITDTVTGAATQGLGFAKFLFNRQNLTSRKHLSRYDSSSEQPSSAGIFQVSAVIFPVDAVAPPPVKSSIRTIPRKLARKTRRTRRRSLTGGGAEEGEDGGFFGDGSDGDGQFGGGGGDGGRWNFDRFGGSNWDDSSSASYSDPAFDFLYEVICWIALSNCLHFAFKKVVRIVADGIGDTAREKVSMRLTPIC